MTEYVYVVLAGMDYEGTDIIGVFSMEILANVAAEEIKAENRYDSVSVERWEVA